MKPAHAAVDLEKQRELIAMAHQDLHHFRIKPPWRVDAIRVYLEEPAQAAQMELFKNAFPVA